MMPNNKPQLKPLTRKPRASDQGLLLIKGLLIKNFKFRRISFNIFGFAAAKALPTMA